MGEGTGGEEGRKRETGPMKDNKDIRERSYRKNVSSSVLAGKAVAAAGSPSQPTVAVFGSQAQNQYCCSSLALASRPSHDGSCNTSTNKTREGEGDFSSVAESR